MLVEACKSLGLSEAWTFAVAFAVTHDAVVWAGTLLCLLIDNSNLCPQWRIQRTKWPDAKLVNAAFQEQVVRSLTNPVLLWAIFRYGLAGRVRMDGPLDSWLLFAAKSVVAFAVVDVTFYWGHRLSHHAAIYQYVHKQHHRFKGKNVFVVFLSLSGCTDGGVSVVIAERLSAALVLCSPRVVRPLSSSFVSLPHSDLSTVSGHSALRVSNSESKVSCGVAFEYAHPAEALLVNGLPLFLAFYLVNFHISQLLLFLALRLWETIDAHSGYDFPFSPWRYLTGAVNHDLHHSANLGNYGMFPFWDWICGTRTSDLRKMQATDAKQQ